MEHGINDSTCRTRRICANINAKKRTWALPGLVWWLIILAAPALATVSSAAPAFGDARKQHPSIQPQHDAIRLSRSKLYRWRQRCKRNRIDRQLPRLKKAGQPSSRGTVLTFGGLPSKERLSRWFWGATSAPVLLNHETAGMTNPWLRVDPTTAATPPNDQVCRPVSTKTITSAMSNGDESSIALQDDDGVIEGAWWPRPTACPSLANSNNRDSKWRTVRIRRRVGRGWDCYQRVRDAALNWEFQSKKDGIRVVEPPSVAPQHQNRRGYTVLPMVQDVGVGVSGMRSNSIFPFQPTQSAMQIWSGPGRKLVTYTRNLVWCVTNPVCVVYDWVDQRGSGATDGTVYTSTAYATGRGHWLVGEERVTVAFRPGTGAVDVELLSVSRPSKSLMGRFVWPFVTRKNGLQERFFREHVRSLQEAAGGTIQTRSD